MPRRDGTGPIGMGPMTGRGAGYCNPANNSTLDDQNIYFGGYGCKRGNRKKFYVTGAPGYLRSNNLQASAEDEKTLLSNRERQLENQLKQVKERLSEIEKASE